MTEQQKTPQKHVKLVWALSLAGLIPFALAAITLLVLGKNNGLFLSYFDLFKTWSAVILSFLGGIRWGVALAKSPIDQRDIVFSIAPAILGWMALQLSDAYCVMVLLLLFCLQGAWDSLSSNAGKLPEWFAPIRITLTFLVASAHLLVILALFN